MSATKPGTETTEYKGFNFVKLVSVVLPIIAMLCDVLVNQSVLAGTGAVIAGVVSTAIASAGYSHSRGRVKGSEAIAESIKKKESL
tara:strand:- start:1891 stop:2148 length:258 start_codon:yes stop_codon:yes gene_type:complete